MIRRYLVFWYDGNARRVSIVDDNEDAPKLPFGVDEAAIADECESIDGIVLCADAPHLPYVVLDEAEITWPPEAAEIATEFRVIHSGDGGIETDGDNAADFDYGGDFT